MGNEGRGLRRAAQLALVVCALVSVPASAVAQGVPWTTGWNASGQLGTSGPTRLAPVNIASPDPVRFVHAAGGADFTAALTPSGTVWIWGGGEGGPSCAIGASDERPTLLTHVADARAIAAGAHHLLVLTADGTVYALGANDAGQLGRAGASTCAPARRVEGLPPIRAIAAGVAHSLALDATGHVWAWGANGVGELGDGTTTPRAEPVRVVGLGAVQAIAAGGHDSGAIAADGGVWLWGSNGSNQISEADIAGSTTPVRVQGISDGLAIAIGAGHVLVLRADKTVLAWGANGDGQLGDGSYVNSPTPTPVHALYNVRAIAAGAAHSVALGSDGTVWAWGNNVAHEVSVDTPRVRQPLPVRIGGDLRDVRSIAAGDYHTVAIQGSTDAMSDLEVSQGVHEQRDGASVVVSVAIAVDNHGPDDATQVTLEDALPDRVSILSAQVNDGRCEVPRHGGTLVCRFERLANGQRALVQLRFRVPRGVEWTSVAHANTPSLDPDPMNDESTASHAQHDAEPALAARTLEDL